MVEDLTKNLVKVPKSIAISFEEMPYFVRGDHLLDSEQGICSEYPLINTSAGNQTKL